MAFFDESYYLQAKLKQVTANGETDSSGNVFSLATLKQAISDAGMTPEQHYNTYGRSESLNPNPYFNESEYLQAKLVQLKSTGEKDPNGQDYTLDTLMTAIAETGMSAAEHYEVYGSKETTADGHLINPSNAFDANAYVAAKLAELQKGPDAENWIDKTPLQVLEAITSQGMSPISHYKDYGAIEASTAKVAMVQTVPAEQRVANDPVRVTLGEIVPGNYNAATPAPAVATAKPVIKPADMGGLTSTDVSPKVVSPEKPLPTPADNNYVKPPATLVDTNEKPVIPPSTSGSGNASDNWIVVLPDGGAEVIKPDGTPGGTLPPGSIDPDNPVVPDVPVTPPADGGDDGGDTPVDTTAPVFQSAAVSTDGKTITLTYDEALSSVTAGKDAFAVTVGDVANAVTKVEISGEKVILTLTSTVVKDKIVTVKYDDPTPSKDDTNAVQDTSGNDAVSLPATAITNGSTFVPTFTMTESAAGSKIWNIGNDNGNVTLSVDEAGTNYVFTPKNGVALTKLKTAVDKLVVDDAVNLISTAAILKAMTTGVKGNVTVSDTKIAVADANAVDAKVDGVITATISEGDVVTLKTLTDTDNAYAVTVTDASVAATDLKGLEGKTSGLITVGDTVTTITAAAADIQAVKDIYAAASSAITGLGNEAITITNAISAADADAIALKTTGVVTATLTAGTAKAIADALTDTTANAYTITVTDTTADAADLNKIDAATSVNVGASSVTTVTGTAVEITKLYTNTANFTGLSDEAVTVTGDATVAQANTIDGATSGAVTATISDGTITTLKTLTGTGNAYTIIVSDKPATAADLNMIDAATTVDVDIAAVETITGTIANLKTLYVTNKANFTGLGDENVTVTDAITATSADLNAVLAATKGAVSAKIDAGYATGGVIADLAPGDVLDLSLGAGKLANAACGSVDAVTHEGEWFLTNNGLFSWHDGTDVNAITLTGVEKIVADPVTGKMTIGKGVFKVGNGGAGTVYTVGGQNGDVSVATNTNSDLVFTATDGSTATIIKSIVDTITTLTVPNTITLKGNVAALTACKVSTGDIIVDGDYTAAQLKVINTTHTAGTITLADNSIALAGTHVDLSAALAGTTNYAGNVTVNDKANVAELTALDGKNGAGTVTATTVEDAIANIVTGGTVSAYATGAVTVTLTDTAGVDLAALKALDAATTGTITATGITGVSGSTAEAKAVFTNEGTAAGNIDLLANVAVTLDDVAATTETTPLLATDLSAIGGATTGTVTVSNAVTISGTLTDMTAALVTAESLVAAASANLVISTAIGASEIAALASIDTATNGTITLQGTANDDTYNLAGYTGGKLTINGGASKDTITATSGDDTINGGTGKDTMTGGTGADTFVFVKDDSAATTTDADIIKDIVAGDKIDLSAISTAFVIASGVVTSVSGAGITFTNGFDIFVFIDSANANAKYIVYETDAGNGTTAGALEVIGIETSDATFATENISGGIITLV